jgi:predicted nucleotidyltransferase
MDGNSMNINDTVISRLNEIEKEEGIQILFACESGSRAWGFASADSDFDIRFVFKRPLRGYMVLQDPPDTLEYPIKDNLDFSGWDIKQFLLHLYKSNGVMFEWLQSPVKYWDSRGFCATLSNVMNDYFNPRSTINHYLGLTKRTLLDFGESEGVKLKKYFYVLRPLMAARWVHGRKCIPPMDFASLLSASEFTESVLSKIADLQRLKAQCLESQLIPRLTDLEAFVHSELDFIESHLPEKIPGRDISDLNALFLHYIASA